MEQSEIVKLLADSDALEKQYRTKRQEFLIWLEEAAEAYPESETVRVWKARIDYEEQPAFQKPGRSILFIVLVSILAGSLVKLHDLPFIEADWYLTRFVPVIVIGSLIFYFLVPGGFVKNRIPFLGVLIGAIILAILPEAKDSDSVTMSLIHMPLVYLSLLAFAFMKGDWKSNDTRIQFVRYLGEMGIYASVILLGGMVLTAITLSLFSLIKVDIHNWYFEYVVVLGLTAAPIVATFLYDVALGRASHIATIIANIFAPLFLITICAYLATIIIEGKSPFTDRDFLITINGLLLVVLAITVFSISGKSENRNNRLIDYVNVGLILTTIIINMYALSAILFRWAEYGLTANRVAVTGINILIFGHLVVLLKEYISQLKEHASSKRLLNAVAHYLPVYSGWSLIIVVVLPIAFWFE